MKYVVQICTGSQFKLVYNAKEVIERLDYLASKLPISKVVIGWNGDVNFNKQVSDFLRNKNIESYFWLPIFSEIIDMNIEDPYIEEKDPNAPVQEFYGEDTFEFVCQASNKNIDYIINEFDKIAKDVKFDGVFIDRIRYMSPAISMNAIFGCQCDNCLKLYEENGINIKELKKKDLAYFEPSKLVEGHYEYKNSDADKLMKFKRDTITRQVARLYDAFKSRGLKMGIDTFALEIADYVGQDIIELNKHCDFIKPMNYLCTTAPAGIPFEMDKLGSQINEAIENIWDKQTRSIEGSKAQLKYLLDNGVRASVGIDCNFVENICHSNKEYVLSHVKALKEVGASELVLSWNAMLLDNELVEQLVNI